MTHEGTARYFRHSSSSCSTRPGPPARGHRRRRRRRGSRRLYRPTGRNRHGAGPGAVVGDPRVRCGHAGRSGVRTPAEPSPSRSVTDARRRELFCAQYENYRTPGGGGDCRSPDAIQQRSRAFPCSRPRAHYPRPGRTYQPCETTLAMGGAQRAADRQHRGLPTQPTQPLYLRRPDVSPSTGPKSVLR